MHFEESRVITTEESLNEVLKAYSPASNTPFRHNEIRSKVTDPHKCLPIHMLRIIGEHDCVTFTTVYLTPVYELNAYPVLTVNTLKAMTA